MKISLAVSIFLLLICGGTIILDTFYLGKTRLLTKNIDLIFFLFYIIFAIKPFLFCLKNIQYRLVMVLMSFMYIMTINFNVFSWKKNPYMDHIEMIHIISFCFFIIITILLYIEENKKLSQK
jgi:hypothetical protein